jgi:hypothetical protein
VLRNSDIWNLVIALIVMGGAMLKGKQPEDQPSNRNTGAPDDSDYSWDDKKWRGGSYPHWYADHSDYQGDERRYWRHQVWALWTNVGISGAALIAAVIAACIALGAYNATQQQADIASRAFIASQKPFIFLKELSIATESFQKDDLLVTWSETWHNSGATTGRKLKIWGDCVDWKSGQKIDFNRRLSVTETVIGPGADQVRGGCQTSYSYLKGLDNQSIGRTDSVRYYFSVFRRGHV